MKNTTLQECHHCHLPIKEAVTGKHTEYQYCCYGCMMVDELMQNHSNLIDYDHLKVEAWKYLDEPTIRKGIITFEDRGQARIDVHLPAIHCSSCIYLLENLCQVEENILKVEVNFAQKQAAISYRSDNFSLSQLAALLHHIGYSPDFQTQLQGNRKSEKLLLLQLGVAGFFFGNTMLLALPGYFDESLAADGELRNFFHYLMLSFSIPVVLFSSRDYFTNAWKSLRAGMLSIDLPIALGISALFTQSAYEVLSGSGSGYFDSLTGLVFFLLIGKWYQQKTYQNFSFDRDFKAFIPLYANKLGTDGDERPIAVDDLQAGDIIAVRQGEVLAADSELLSDFCSIDYSYITGEALPVMRKKGERIFAGARISGATTRFRILKTANRSYLSSLWSSEVSGNKISSPSLTDKLARYFTPAIILIAILSSIAWSFIDADRSVSIFVAVLIVACPCALALAEPFASGSMMRWFGKNGLFLKNNQVLSRLQSISSLVFDKTGTLTLQTDIQLKWVGQKLSQETEQAIGSIAAQSSHPLASPLLLYLKVSFGKCPVDFHEQNGEGISALYDGHHYRIGKASFVKTEEKGSTTSVYVSCDNSVLGHFEFYQHIRPETSSILRQLQQHYPLYLLSGDNDKEKERFESLLGTSAELKFNCAPREKLDFVKNLQRQGKRVLMLGDGLNDAGALQQSDVGISLCEKNINFFPPSDALLIADSLGKLPHFIALSKVNSKIIRQAFIISLVYNIGGLSLAIAGLLSPIVCAILMPLSSVSIVLFTTGMTALKSRKAFRSQT